MWTCDACGNACMFNQSHTIPVQTLQHTSYPKTELTHWIHRQLMSSHWEELGLMMLSCPNGVWLSLSLSDSSTTAKNSKGLQLSTQWVQDSKLHKNVCFKHDWALCFKKALRRWIVKLLAKAFIVLFFGKVPPQWHHLLWRWIWISWHLTQQQQTKWLIVIASISNCMLTVIALAMTFHWTDP